MFMSRKCISILTLLAASCFLYACSNGSNGAAAGGRGGSGGFLATGGTAETGGTSGGQLGTGGATASGGGTAASNGGSINLAGGAPSGGTTGESTGSGGARFDGGVDAAAGGSTGSGGARLDSGAPAGGATSSGGARLDGGVDVAASSGGARLDGGVDGAASSGGARLDGSAAPATGGSDASASTGVGGMTSAARTISNIYYTGNSSASQSLDLLLPANARLPLPLIVRFHGGGFSSGDKAGEETGTAAKAILAKGYALASVNYRLSGQALFPAGAQDAKAAMRWLRAHAVEYGLDTDHFASWGESAGGYLAVMIGVTGDQVTVFDDDSLGYPGVSSAVAAVVDWYGPVDLATMDSQQTAKPPAGCPSSWLQHTPANSPEGQWLGGALNTPAVSAKLAQANLTAYIATAKSLPFFIIAQGDNDCQVPWGQSQELNDTLAKVGNKANLTILAGASHGDGRFESTQSTPDLALLAPVFGR